MNLNPCPYCSGAPTFVLTEVKQANKVSFHHYDICISCANEDCLVNPIVKTLEFDVGLNFKKISRLWWNNLVDINRLETLKLKLIFNKSSDIIDNEIFIQSNPDIISAKRIDVSEYATHIGWQPQYGFYHGIEPVPRYTTNFLEILELVKKEFTNLEWIAKEKQNKSTIELILGPHRIRKESSDIAVAMCAAYVDLKMELIKS